MSIVFSLAFPHGRYHATPWDQAANNGVVEWPPSPWRIVRALIAVAYTRHPDVPVDAVIDALRPLTEPPTYFLPPTRRGHTRHYMPKSSQRTGENQTQLVFDSYVSVAPEDKLLIEWPNANPPVESRSLLCELAASLPYLGRAESSVDAQVIDNPPDPESWVGSIWRPSVHGLRRLMCPERTATQRQLEVAVHQMRKGHRLVPEGSRWVPYEEVDARAPEARHSGRSSHRVEVMRWRLVSPAPFRAINGILATDRLRMIALSVTKPAAEREDAAAEDRHPDPITASEADLLSGHMSEAAKQHRHAHWLWTEKDGQVHDLVLWVPKEDENGAGLLYETAARVAAVVSGIGLRTRDDGDYVPAGFVTGDLNLVGWGGREVISDLLFRPDGGRAAKVWRSATPHLLVRRGKKGQTLESLAWEDVRSELRFRCEVPPIVTSVVVERRPVEARLYRRFRWKERLSRTVGDGRWSRTTYKDMVPERIPVWLKVEFEEPVEGPLILGGLSHFGFGRLEPVR